MRRLVDNEYSEVWDNFQKNFAFRPSVKGPFPAIKEPDDAITFLLARDYDDDMIDELRNAIFSAFAECIPESQEFYYLDWQHECFALNNKTATDFWVNGFPDGDYAIFLSKDMRIGTFGHPWEYSICIFGEAFARAIIKQKPVMLAKVIRNAGGYDIT
ncbi:DUF2716 domain-containing protein [Undibacterium sp. Di27W]|uniref:DUF2716 domain-containing protein n=1 Tax=Undibacterium sp. Di27W TaxID=3413036 RepID=UPI003BF296B7